MKKLLGLAVFLTAIMISFRSGAETVKIAALVNGEIISSEDIQNRVNAFLLTTKIPYNAQTKNMIAQRVLNMAIDEKLKLQEAAKNGIEITPEEITSQLHSFERNNKIPMGQLNKILKKARVTHETFKSQMESDLAWVRVVRKKYYADGGLTQKEINQAWEEAKKDLATPKYLVSEIFIKKDNARNLNDLVSNLREDPRFELYAMQFSDSPSASNGGNLGWVNSGRLPAPLENTLNKLKEGAVSEPVALGDGYYVYKLQKRFDPSRDKADVPTANEVRTFLENTKMETLSKKLLQDARQRAVIEIRA